MPLSTSRKRTLTEALGSPELGAAADAFVQGVPRLVDSEVVAELPESSGALGNPGSHVLDNATGMANGPTIQYAGPPVPVPGKVSLSVRIPTELAQQLAQTAATRKLNRHPPFSQQEIVVQALAEWIAKIR